ncbi:MAG: divalent metal cation transporter [Clostridiales bacterium]
MSNDANIALQEAEAKTGLSRWKAYAKLMGPAWLAIALNIGGATVANAGQVASKTGYTYLWAILPEVFVIWIVCVLFVRLALKTGKGPIAIAREYIGPWAGWVTAISIFIVNTVFHAIQYAIVGNIMNTLFGVTPKVGTIIGFIFVLSIVLNPAKGERSIKIITNACQWLVWILLASFTLILFIVPINWGDALRGFIPSFNGTSQEIILLAGLMGAAIAINVPSLAAYASVQNKWGPNRKNLSVFELTYTNFMLVVVQLVVMIAVAAVLFGTGTVITGAGTMAATFEPFAGKFSTILLSIGLLGSVLSTMVSQCLVSGYVITDALGWEADMTSQKFKISGLVVTLFGLSAPLIGWNAFSLSTYGSGFNLTFFPIVTILLLYIANKPSVMGELKVGKAMNISVIIAVLLSLLATGSYWVNVLK